MPVLPLTPAQVTAYNNVATTPPTAPLGDVIEELTSGGGSAFGEIRAAAAFIDQLAVPEAGTALTAFSVNGESSGVTVDAANDRIVIDAAGRYALSFFANFAIAIPPAADGNMIFGITVDGVLATDEFYAVQDSGPINPYISQIVDLAEGAVVQVRVRPPDAGDIDIRTLGAVLRVQRLGA